MTEWPEFRGLDLRRLRRLMRQPRIVDLRNIFDPEERRSLRLVAPPTVTNDLGDNKSGAKDLEFLGSLSRMSVRAGDRLWQYQGSSCRPQVDEAGEAGSPDVQMVDGPSTWLICLATLRSLVLPRSPLYSRRRLSRSSRLAAMKADHASCSAVAEGANDVSGGAATTHRRNRCRTQAQGDTRCFA